MSFNPEPIDDAQLAAILDRQERAAIGFTEGELAEQQRIAVDAYYGRPYGDEEDGRSQFVTRDVAEVVDYMTIAVLRAFVSGDHVVEFEGHPKAKEVTAAMHYLFLNRMYVRFGQIHYLEKQEFYAIPRGPCQGPRGVFSRPDSFSGGF